ncbi:hypothetical protein L209DRAFT_476593 [Thermothelomyces heterothallicus CBS 203.75]
MLLDSSGANAHKYSVLINHVVRDPRQGSSSGILAPQNFWRLARAPPPRRAIVFLEFFSFFGLCLGSWCGGTGAETLYTTQYGTPLSPF